MDQLSFVSERSPCRTKAISLFRVISTAYKVQLVTSIDQSASSPYAVCRLLITDDFSGDRGRSL